MPSPLELLEAALESRLISRKQYKLIIEELDANPDMPVEELLLARHYLTKSQIRSLSTVDAGAPPAPPPTPPSIPVPAAPPPAITPPPVPQSSPPQFTPLPVPTGTTPPPVAHVSAPPTIEFPVRDDISLGNLGDMLRYSRHIGASDLHISVDRPPFVRINGEIRYLNVDPLTAEQTTDLNFQVLTDEQRARLEQKWNLDFALELEQVGRHRCNIFRQRLGWDGVYRIISTRMPSCEELDLPPVMRRFTEYHQGMVLVTGPSRSGKTTTLAAMVNLVNANRDDHIITVEDPIEYVHWPQRCQVTQREIGLHSESFGMSLRAALREDPDIIMVGELRDHETISIAISAAETGHLVLGTLHTGSAARTVNRILDVYPANQRAQISTMISESLRGIVSQLLLPNVAGDGLALAKEILVVSSGVSAIIREGKMHQLTSIMQSGRRQGMMTMDDSLLELHKAGKISGETAWRHAENRLQFEALRER